ncbi:putative N-acetyltransferase B complex non catalytic subunit-domain-containing protein [Seiridium cardinale]|uniref:N-acetyltransferase B complex non catalytic subunit-domain-containing protein n=1 Tax=Seiridium cardinale TaxID=138064 RepID=A0ABR2XMI7_9PEZI
MSASYTHGSLPSLRPNCDANVQIAFGESRWAQVITYAKQQFKRSRDPYYEAIETAARSQLDTPADQYAAFIAVEKLLGEGKVVKDHWTIELYDWACTRIDKDYAATIGTLRAGFVKEAWKPDVDKAAPAIRSFYACVINDDWVNAQKIAAMVDQKFPKEPRHQFYNILSYYVLSTQLPPSDPKKTMFRTLATRLVEKARDLRDSTPASAGFPPRAITSEEELLLWLHINISCAKDDTEIVDLLKKPEFDALKRLSEGSVSVFKEIMSLLEKYEAWDDLFRIAQELFDKGLAYLVESANAESATPVAIKDVVDEDDEIRERMKNILDFTATRAEEIGQSKKEAESRAFQSAVMDWSLWKQFIGAASHLENDRKAIKQLRGFLTKVSKITKVLPIYKKQMEIANLSILFNRYRSSTIITDGKTEAADATKNTRVEHLTSYVVSNYKLVSCFDDLKPYLEQLSFEEIKTLLQRIGEEGGKESNDVFQNTMLLTLRLRFRYLFTTTPESHEITAGEAKPKCKFCGAVISNGLCQNCLTSLAKSCVWIYNQGFREKHLRARIDTEDVDPFADLAIVGTTCLLKLAGLTSGYPTFAASPLHYVDLKFVLQAISWLNSHYNRASQKNAAIPVYLTKLYLLIGCVPQAKLLWSSLGVKNVTLDSLGPLFSDRLSSIAPGMWRAGASTPMNDYHQYYKTAIRKTIPTNIRTALELANYPSVLGLLTTRENLSQSCTLIMANIEDRRGLRAIGSKPAFETKDDVLLRLIKDDKELLNVTDNVALPNHECDPATLADVVNIGPGLSDRRAKLSLLTERFLSLISYKDAKEYKPTKSVQMAELDRSNVSLQAKLIYKQFEDSLMNYQSASTAVGAKPCFTGAEFSYFTIVHLLIGFVVLSSDASWTKNASRPPALANLEIVSTITSMLQAQVAELQKPRKDLAENVMALDYFASLHNLGMLREAVQAVKIATGYLERVIVPFKNDVPKWLVDDIKAFSTSSLDAAAAIKKRIKSINDAANASGWLDRISEFAFGDLASGAQTIGEASQDPESSDLLAMVFMASGQKAGLEHTIGEIKDSWQEVAKGWNTVKLD